MLNKLKISQKLWLLTTGIILVLSLGYYLYFQTTVERQFREGLLKKGRSIVQTSAINLGASLFLDDEKSMADILNGLENDSDVALIYVTGRQNEAKYEYHYQRYKSIIRSFQNSNRIQKYSESLLLLKQSIFHRDEYQGDIIVGFSLDWVNKNVARQNRNLLYIGAVLGAVLILLASLIARAISKPLKEAAATIRNYSDKEGVLNLELPEKGKDEIAQLSRALNQLAGNLDNNIRELDKSKRYIETLFQLSPVPILIADTLGQIEGVNESTSNFFGVESSVLIQMNLDRFFQQEDLNAIFNRIIQDMQDVRGYVTTLKMTDGTKKVVELNIASHQDEMNYVKNIIVAIIDITEKIQIQREILHNQTKLQRINNELTLKTRELQRLSSWNKKNARRLAVLINISQEMMRSATPNEILQKIVKEGRALLEAQECAIYLWDQKRQELVASVASPSKVLDRITGAVAREDSILWKTYSENEPFVFDSEELDRKDFRILGLKPKLKFSLVSVPVSEKDYCFGVILFLKQNHNAFRVEDVHLLSTLANQAASLLDNIYLVHELKDKAQRLEKAYDQLQKSQQQVVQLQKMESLGTLVGGIAHDFNNILGIIIPNTDLLRNDADGNSAVLRRVNTIAEAAHRASDLTRQLLMFSRNQDIQVKVLSVNELITRLTSMFKRILGKEFEILLELDRNIPEVEADETRLTQVMINLAVNARDAMPEGGKIIIRTRLQRYQPKMNGFEARDYVCISLTDTGCGIKGENFDKIFDPFFTTKSVGKGTGLGLSVVYGIMQSHKGFVDVESEEGKGTTFYLYLPPSGKKLKKVEEAPDTEIPRGTENILVVDDEEMIRNSVEEILQSLGYSVTVAASGMEAIRIIRQKQKHFHLAIVDLSMPKMNGKETIRHIRKLDKSVKILLSSGHLEREKLVPPGMKIEGLLPKPYRIRELAIVVRKVLGQKVHQTV